jgi:hypothetical protein
MQLRSSHTLLLQPCAFRYDAFTGNPAEYLDWQNSSSYNKTVQGNKWGWYPVPCNSSYASVCEVPHTSIACPVSLPARQLDLHTQTARACDVAGIRLHAVADCMHAVARRQQRLWDRQVVT